LTEPANAVKRTHVKIDRKSIQATSYSTVGLELALSILFGMFGGRWLDGKLGTDPVLMLVGLGFGVATGFRFVYRAAQRMQKQTEDDAFRSADVGRPARFAMSERLAASKARRAAARPEDADR
jgi:ATP synthase protein I